MNISPKELQVIKKVALGFSSKVIAEQLKITRSTVDKHRENAMRKTNTRNAVELSNFYYNELEK